MTDNLDMIMALHFGTHINVLSHALSRSTKDRVSIFSEVNGIGGINICADDNHVD